MWLFMKDRRFPVTEIFESIDGEGLRAGRLAVFVRFAGCNLRCSYCDTVYSQNHSDASEIFSEDGLCKAVSAFGRRNITFTGGEPLMHDIEGVVRRLCSEGMEANIETNGSMPLFTDRPDGCFYTLDFKCPSSGISPDKMLLSNYPLLIKGDAVKFVVGSEEDLEKAAEIAELIPSDAALFFSPVFGKLSPERIVEFMRKNSLERFRLQLQLHKYIWPPEMRGV